MSAPRTEARVRKPPAARGRTRAVPQQFAGRIARRFACQYLLYQPAGKPGRTGWPLILFLHGAGERGRRVTVVRNHGPLQLAERPPGLPFVIAAPQCPRNACWDAASLIALLDHLLNRYPIDRRRVYLTGLSMGAYGVWELAVQYPERFAAVAPICGGGSPLPLLLQDGPKIRLLKQLPVWAFHGGCDDVVPPSESERMVYGFTQIGGNVRYTVYPEVAHDAWTQTYNNPELYEWFLRHRRR
jgi:predicted peptidase